MAKVAIKNENFTSFSGIYYIMDIFSKLGCEKLIESVLGKRGSSGKAFCYGSIFGSLFFSYLPHSFGWRISCIDKTQETPKNLITTRRASKRHLNTQNRLTRKNAAELRLKTNRCLIGLQLSTYWRSSKA